MLAQIKLQNLKKIEKYVWQMSLMFMCMLGCYVASSLISTQTFQRVLTALVDSCVEIKSAPSVS